MLSGTGMLQITQQTQDAQLEGRHIWGAATSWWQPLLDGRHILCLFNNATPRIHTDLDTFQCFFLPSILFCLQVGVVEEPFQYISYKTTEWCFSEQQLWWLLILSNLPQSHDSRAMSMRFFLLCCCRLFLRSSWCLFSKVFRSSWYLSSRTSGSGVGRTSWFWAISHRLLRSCHDGVLSTSHSAIQFSQIV